jgi:hypothetical protein
VRPSSNDEAMIDEDLQHERQKCQEAHQDVANSETVGMRVGSNAEVMHQKNGSWQYSQAIEQIEPGNVGHQL